MTATTSNYPNLGKNIRGLRKAYGETLLELALAINAKGPSTISQYESGERMPERDFLLRIAKHYRITENELLHGDFEHMPNLTKTPVNNNEYNLAMLVKTFPLICTSKALENPNFKAAHTIHERLLEQLVNGVTFDDAQIETCMRLYKIAGKDGLVEATANHLWWIMFLGFLTVLFTPRLFDSLDIIDANKASFKDFINTVLPSFSEDDNELDFDTTQNRIEFLTEYEVDLIVDIILLRQSKEYSDLGDYYLALRHKFSLLQNSLSTEMNSAVGDELLLTFSLMGNKYCKAFAKPYSPER